VKRARFISVAAREFLAEVAYYDEATPGDGARFTAAVERATALALAFPLAGGIVVFAVAHSSKRPGYWQSRVR
jgi:hypothetical protein